MRIDTESEDPSVSATKLVKQLMMTAVDSALTERIVSEKMSILPQIFVSADNCAGRSRQLNGVMFLRTLESPMRENIITRLKIGMSTNSNVEGLRGMNCSVDNKKQQTAGEGRTFVYI